MDEFEKIRPLFLQPHVVVDGDYVDERHLERHAGYLDTISHRIDTGDADFRLTAYCYFLYPTCFHVLHRHGLVEMVIPSHE